MIAKCAEKVIQDGMNVLMYGSHEAYGDMMNIIQDKRIRINVYTTEKKVEKLLEISNIQHQFIEEPSIGHLMSDIDLVFIGAQAILQNGTIIN